LIASSEFSLFEIGVEAAVVPETLECSNRANLLSNPWRA